MLDDISSAGECCRSELKFSRDMNRECSSELEFTRDRVKSTRSGERRTRSDDEFPRSVEKLTRSVEGLVQSGEKFTRSVEKLTRSVERLTRSVERLTRSVERLTRSVERLTRSAVRSISDRAHCTPAIDDSRFDRANAPKRASSSLRISLVVVGMQRALSRGRCGVCALGESPASARQYRSHCSASTTQ